MNYRALAVAVLVVGTTLVAVPAPATGPCSAPTIRGTPDDDRLRGTDGPDVIDAGAGDDRILGLAGDDVICGGPGQDRLIGGPGVDRLHGGTDAKVAEDTEYYVYYGDTLDGGPGSDILDGGTDPRHDGSRDTLVFAGLPDGVSVDLATGTAVSGADTDTVVGPASAVHGTDHDDVLLGSDADDSLSGGLGADRLHGRAGNDWLDGGDYHGGGDRSPNILIGGRGQDELIGDRGDDLLRGGRGSDLIQAESGIDRSYGGRGRDGIHDDATPQEGQVLDGGPGRDDLAGVFLRDHAGRFKPNVTGRIDMETGTLRAAIGDITWDLQMTGFEEVATPRGELWTVRGTDGPDDISAGFFSDPVRIFARGGNDRVFGSDQRDVIFGGPGYDKGSGWRGRDRIRSVEKIFSW